MSSFDFNLPSIADTLVNQSAIFNCSLKEAWENYMHPLITGQATFDEVKAYIDNKVALGEQYKKREERS